MSIEVQSNQTLAPRTTLGIGGPARHLIEAFSIDHVVEALDWVKLESIPLYVLGGGSNLVVSDHGVEGLVLQMMTQGIEVVSEDNEHVDLKVAAGHSWDALVRFACEQNYQGLECLSGIPGTVGATPIQNVGAYGQEVAETISQVRVYDREAGSGRTFMNRSCSFAYRSSRFKHELDQFVVLEVTFRLRKNGAPAIRYGELQRVFQGRSFPSLLEVREQVLELRRSKSMTLDVQSDPNRKSVGSFFLNAIVPVSKAAEIFGEHNVTDLNHLKAPVFAGPTPTERKVAAAWLIEQAGFKKGLRRGNVGISSAHSLALVNHGGATAAELLVFADEIKAGVADKFGIGLEMEPRVW